MTVINPPRPLTTRSSVRQADRRLLHGGIDLPISTVRYRGPDVVVELQVVR